MPISGNPKTGLRDKPGKKWRVLAAILNSACLGISLAVFLGYLSRMEMTFGGIALSPVLFVEACIFLLLGTGITFWICRETSPEKGKSLQWLFFSSWIIAILVAAVIFCQALIGAGERQIKEMTQKETEKVRAKITARLEKWTALLEKEAGGWEVGRGILPGLKKGGTSGSSFFFPDYAFIQKTKSSFQRKLTVPFQGKKAPAGFDPDSREIWELIQKSVRRGGGTVVTPLFDIPGEGKAFLICVPVFGEKEADGFLVFLGLVRVRPFLEGLLAEESERGYSIEVLDQTTLLYEVKNPLWPVPKEGYQETLIHFRGGLDWRVRIWLQSRISSELLSSFSTGLIFAGLLAALVLTLTFYFASAARQREKEIRAASQNLQQEMTARQKIQVDRSHLAAIVESSLDAIAGISLEETITSWNRGAQKMYGYTIEEIMGQPFLKLIPPGRFQETAEILERVRRGGAVENFETERVRKDGTHFYISLTLSPIRDVENRIAGFSSIARDISEQKAVREKLASQARELARSNADLEQFAYVASHDLQEPLRMVSSYTQLLAERYRDKLDPEASEFINYAVDGALRAQQLIHALMEYARLGSRLNAFSRIELDQVLERVRVNLKILMEETGAGVLAGKLPAVMGDEIQLTQLFQNLISNAMKFRKKEEPLRVQIEAEPSGGEWLFSVRDNGIGFERKHAQRIFLIFQRLHTRQEYPGTGIGLAVTQKIVEYHGGRIWAESEPGKGSVFYFTLPRGL